MKTLFSENGQPFDGLEEMANDLETQAHEFLSNLVKQGYSYIEIRAAGGYLISTVNLAVSSAILDKRDQDYKKRIKDTDPNLNENEMNLARNNDMIPAIRAYRERTGLGLKESKDAVQKWIKEKL